jgi:predicted nucleotidyltransferase
MRATEPKPDTLVDRLRVLLEPRVEVLEAYLFGSAVHGRAQRHSDIDVAVYVNEGRCGARPFGYRAELTTALMAGLGTDAIDTVILNHAPPLLYHRVLRDGVRLLARDLRATTVREAMALSRYCDFVPQLDKLERLRGERPSPRVPRS